MLLKDYYPKLNKKYSNLNFKGISFDSKLIKKDFIFFAIKGNNVDGNNYIKEAITRGSKIIISDKYQEGLNNSVLYLKNKKPNISVFGSTGHLRKVTFNKRDTFNDLSDTVISI